MGNCAVTHEAVSWADDGEWESPSGADGDAAGRKEHTINEVTIRISKRQLQELIDKRADDGNGHGHFWKSDRGSASELLADIMNAGEVHHSVQHCRAAHWRPALQSIPEAVES
ncbi:hypothetical protein ACQ4PT_060665 [Festuca glaucescens]